jgi:hypothetical protein
MSYEISYYVVVDIDIIDNIVSSNILEIKDALKNVPSSVFYDHFHYNFDRKKISKKLDVPIAYGRCSKYLSEDCKGSCVMTIDGMQLKTFKLSKFTTHSCNPILQNSTTNNDGGFDYGQEMIDRVSNEAIIRIGERDKAIAETVFNKFQAESLGQFYLLHTVLQ